MSTTSIPNDTREGIQQCLDVLHSRRSALAALWAEAADRHDADQMAELGGRQAEIAGMIRAIRGLLS